MNRHDAEHRGILSPLRLPNSATPACLILKDFQAFGNPPQARGVQAKTRLKRLSAVRQKQKGRPVPNYHLIREAAAVRPLPKATSRT